MVLVEFQNCGQSFDKDVGIYDITREELQASIDRCNGVSDVDELCELVEGENYDYAVFDALRLFEDWMTHNRDDVYLYLSSPEDEALLYFGPDEHFATVVGSIMAVQHGKGHLPDELE